jgi:hypothetical protein
VQCVDARPRVVAATPAQGFRVDDPGEDPDEVTFESASTDVDARLTCRDGVPVVDVRVDPDD